MHIKIWGNLLLMLVVGGLIVACDNPSGVPTVASGRRQSQALEMPFFGQNPPFCGLHAIVLWLVTPLRTYFLVLFALKVVFTTFLF